MGTLYLVEALNSVLANSTINDTVMLSSGSRSIRGSFVVNVPFDVPLDANPTVLSDLVTKKYAGLLSIYAGFAHIAFDEQDDSSGWDTATANRVMLGSRKTNMILAGGSITSLPVALASTPQSCVLRWELFQYTDVDPATDLYTRAWQEVDPGTVTCTVTFNGGSTSTTVNSGVLHSIDVPDRGSSFKISFSNGTGSRLGIGSWALVY